MVLLDLSQTDPAALFGTVEKAQAYYCAVCGMKLAEQEDLIAVLGQKTYHTFTNPGGFTFNLLTFGCCQSFREISRPESSYSWFPGYSWIVINCTGCDSLLGWKYVSEKESPLLFFGLIREQIVLS